MTEQNGLSDIEKQMQGINLALDPNLITLPTYKTSASPIASASASASATTVSDKNISSDANTLPSSSNKDSLIANPHEVYNNMPLTQLIPLILQQKGPGFRFADLSEEQLMYELEHESQKGIHDNNGGEADNTKNSSLPEDMIDDMDVDYDDKNATFDYTNEDLLHGNISGNVERSTTNEENSTNVGEDIEEMTQERYNTLRKEMLENISMALNESSLSLEFVSLLLSGSKESAGTSSMSQFLKKTVPVGSLRSDQIDIVQKTPDDVKRLEALDRGWKLNALDESAEILKNTHLRLKKTLQREHTYWNNFSKNINNKDVIFKMRDRITGQRYLGMKYGYSDSGSTYKYDQGTANLKTNPMTGSLELFPNDYNSTEFDFKNNSKFIRLRIYTKIEGEDDFILSGETVPNKVFLLNDNVESHDIRAQIERSKALIFEKELMYQLKKESSLLIPYGVTLENENKIVIELPNEKFEIDYLSLTDDSVINHEHETPNTNDKRAEIILITLRILQVIMFKKTMKKKLTTAKKTLNVNINKDILLIRPILGVMRHHNYKVLLRKIIRDNIVNILDDCTLNESNQSQSKEEKSITLDRHIVKLENEISSFDKILNTQSSIFEIEIANHGNFEILLESTNYCNAIVTLKYKDEKKDVTFDTKFTEFKEFEEFLNFIVSEYITTEGEENEVI